MIWWSFITALGGLSVTGSLSVAIAGWLAMAHCRVRALYWCLLFGAAMLIVIASKLAFIGWGIGLMSVDFAGFSGHAARAGAVLPVAAYLVARRYARAQRAVAVAAAVLLAILISYSRVVVTAHSPSEAVLGCGLGLLTAALFIALVRTPRDYAPPPVLIGLTVAVMLASSLAEPRLAPAFDSQQFMTALALNLSGHDRPYQRWDWKPSQSPYVPPCSSERVHFGYVCV